MPFWKTKRVAAIAIILTAMATAARGEVTQASYMGEIVGRNGLEVYVKSNTGIAVIADLSPERKINGVHVQNVPALQVEVTGEIRGEHLTKGMYVRFSAKIQGKSRPQTVEPVKQMEVFTPDAQTKFGLLGDGVVGGGEKVAPDAVREARVVGVITSLRGSTMKVAFPRGDVSDSLSAKVADDAVINVKVNQLITPNGAQVMVEGQQMAGAQPPVRVLATKLQIQLPPPPPPKRKVAAAGPTDKDQEDKPDKEGAAPADGNEAGEAEAVAADGIKVPGKILKVN